MVKWTDPEALQHQGAIFRNVIHFIAGFYAWEAAIQFFAFDWSIISGKRRFRWPMLLYFGCRYLMLSCFICGLVLVDAKQQLKCQALLTFIQFSGGSGMGLASSLLMVRTIAVWNRNLWITIPLVLINLGQWAVLLHGITNIVASWVPQENSCVFIQSSHLFLDLMYFYTMCFDLIVLIVTTLGLFLAPGRSTLSKLLFTDGMMFFAVAFVSNAFPAIFTALNLSPVMNIIFSVPAAGITAVVSCRSFIRLSTYADCDKHIHTSKSDQVITHAKSFKTLRGRRGSQAVETSDPTTGLPFHSMTAGGRQNQIGGVHVLMETYSHVVGDGKAQDEVYAAQENEAWDGKTGHSFVPDV